MGTVTPAARPFAGRTSYPWAALLGVWRDALGIEYVRVYDLIEVPPDG